MNKLEEISKTSDDSDIGYFIEVFLKYLDDIKERTKNFPFCPENKIIPKDNYIDYMNKIKHKNFTIAIKLISDWINKKIFNSLQDVEILC